MKKRILTFIAASLLTLPFVYSQEKEYKSTFGIGGGFSPARTVWIGDPVNLWAHLDGSPIFHVFYSYQIMKPVRIGPYLEFETAKFENTSDKANRFNIGFNWLTMYPLKPLHFQFGGYMGYGFVKADVWDQSLNGIDYGIMVGPAYEKDNFGIALHLQSGFAYYISSGVPDEASYSKERLLIKLYYKF
jgi:hypothetical protein